MGTRLGSQVFNKRRPGPLSPSSTGSDQATRLRFKDYPTNGRRFRASDLHFHALKCTWKRQEILSTHSSHAFTRLRSSFLEQGFQGEKHESKGENCPILELFPPEYNHFPWSGPEPRAREPSHTRFWLFEPRHPPSNSRYSAWHNNCLYKRWS
jgi:hypothetical protein